VIGISREQWRLVAAAAALGGNVRVGLEDNFYLPDGEMARSNGDLVARARRMVEDVGRRAASAAEARELLGTPKREPVTRRELLAHPIDSSEAAT
jgi:3-keto-5-aminohexanoate cleavage enzyme